MASLGERECLFPSGCERREEEEKRILPNQIYMRQGQEVGWDQRREEGKGVKRRQSDSLSGCGRERKSYC